MTLVFSDVMLYHNCVLPDVTKTSWVLDNLSLQIKTLQPFKILRNTSPEDTELLSQEVNLQQQHGEKLKSYTLTNSKVQLCHTSNPYFNTKVKKKTW